MAKQTISIGSSANDGNGDPLRDAFDKCNDNFDEVYSALAATLAVTDTAANMTSNNPTLADGQFGFETDTGLLKIGDGSTAWTGLPYFYGGRALIEEYTGNSTTGTKTFSSIPGIFRNLEIVFSGRGSQTAAATVMSLQFNGDSGSNYDYQRLQASANTTQGGESIGGTSVEFAALAAASSPAGSTGSGRAIIPDYAGTTFHKSVQSNYSWKGAASSGGLFTRQAWGQWRNTAAINSITLALASGNYVTGTKIQLYGLF